eukprot:253647_1
MSTVMKQIGRNYSGVQLIATIDEIFGTILYQSYSKIIKELVSLFDKCVINSTYLKLFINTTLKHITAYHMYDPIFGSLYKQLADIHKNNSISKKSNSMVNVFEMTLSEILRNKFKTESYQTTLMKFIGALYLVKLLPLSFVDECLNELTECKLYPITLTNQHIISICELLQSINKMSKKPQIIIKYYDTLMFIQFHTSRTCVNVKSFATSLMQETIQQFDGISVNVEQLYWNLITFGMVRNMATNLNISIQAIAEIINQYVCKYEKEGK